MILHIDIYIKSVEQALKFYVEGLGFQVIEDSYVDGPLVKYASNNQCDAYRLIILKMTSFGTKLELVFFDDPAHLPKNQHANMTVLVKSLEETMNQLSQCGYLPKSDIFHVSTPKLGDASIVFYEDSDGNTVELLEMKK